jgi:hydrogenase-4 component B
MQILFSLMVLAYLAGALGALIAGRGAAGRWFTAAAAIGGALAGMALGAWVLVGQTEFALTWPALLPLAGGMAFRLDALGAFFLLLIGVGAAPAALYGVGYSAAYADGRVSLRQLGCLFNLFLLSMSLVTLADNVLTFLLVWEGMSLASYFLVMAEANARADGEIVHAGLWYAAMTHAGLALIMAAFLLMAGDGPATFASLRANAAGLPDGTRNLIFVLALLGFGSKAGLVPLHVWLPRAHPAAPSHVSALMSGVMIKLGVYGMLRVTLDLLGGGPAWWGGTVLAIGALSALLGILYALMENDIKRLLAYSSVENMGIIFLGVGAGLLFAARDLPEAAMLAFVAALYHALNHTAFKGLLFLGAGAVAHAAHTRDMNLLGGLIKRMPQTAFLFLIGAVAIAGLPPLNGFVSEWLLFQALLPGVGLAEPLIAALMTLAVGMLALTAGLAAAAFVKTFGISFLALPRATGAEHAREVGRTMLAGMGLLAAACGVLALTPTVVAPAAGRAVAGLAGLPATPPPLTFNLSLQMPADFARVSPFWLALLLLAVLGLTPLALRWLRVNPGLRLGDTWGCGRIGQTPRMEYTATAFAEPLRRVFAELYRPTQELTIDFHPESKYFVQAIEYRTEIRSWFEEYLYAPLLRAVRWLSLQVRRMQSGSLHGYLAYLFLALIALLGLLLWFGRPM